VSEAAIDYDLPSGLTILKSLRVLHPSANLKVDSTTCRLDHRHAESEADYQHVHQPYCRRWCCRKQRRGDSSQIDSWLLLRNVEVNGERDRGLYILKSRGMAHSNQIREMVLTDHGIELVDVYVGAGGVLTGSARAAQEAQERVQVPAEKQEIERKKADLSRKRVELESKIEGLHAAFEAEQEQIARSIREMEDKERQVAHHRIDMAHLLWLTRWPVRDIAAGKQ
jgi:hypothetical protein